MSLLKSALDYAENNAGRFAAIVAVVAPALHLNLSNGEANTLAEVVLFVIFLAEEGARLIQKAAAAHATAAAIVSQPASK